MCIVTSFNRRIEEKEIDCITTLMNATLIEKLPKKNSSS